MTSDSCKPRDAPSAVANSLVGRLPAAEVARIWRKVIEGVTGYGFAIDFRALEAPKTGTFDGLRIRVDPAVELETRCFVLVISDN